MRAKLKFISRIFRSVQSRRVSTFSGYSEGYSFILPTVRDDGIVYDLFSKLLNERIIMISGPIHDGLSGQVVASLIYLQSVDAKAPIHMYINSPGGEVTSGLAIYDTMQYIQPPVCTWCIGQAASMGSFLLAAGAPGARYALPNSKIMVHQVMGGAQGQASDIQIKAKEILRIKQNLNELYVKHTQQPYDIVERTMDRDHYMTPEEAKEFGIIDQIMERPPTAKNIE